MESERVCRRGVHGGQWVHGRRCGRRRPSGMRHSPGRRPQCWRVRNHARALVVSTWPLGRAGPAPFKRSSTGRAHGRADGDSDSVETMPAATTARHHELAVISHARPPVPAAAPALMRTRLAAVLSMTLNGASVPRPSSHGPVKLELDRLCKANSLKSELLTGSVTVTVTVSSRGLRATGKSV